MTITNREKQSLTTTADPRWAAHGRLAEIAETAWSLYRCPTAVAEAVWQDVREDAALLRALFEPFRDAALWNLVAPMDRRRQAEVDRLETSIGRVRTISNLIRRSVSEVGA